MSSTDINASILGIGTELTTGQILNRNGQWLSDQLRKLGIQTTAQLVVPDDKAVILKALQYCADNSDLLFVTGGLGPTSDDFTRDVISTWTGKKLVWDEGSWLHIQARLNPRGIAVREIQKQQCYFPEGSEILTNQLGTANAFCLEHQSQWLCVLPGPPKEIEVLWKDFLLQKMQDKSKNVDVMITKSWDTIGVGESDIAHLAEQALEGCTFEKAYRVHLPFVEFKISYPQSQSTEAQAWLQKLEKNLGPLTALRDGEDAARELAKCLEKLGSVRVEDRNKGSFILQRLFPFAKNLLAQNKIEFFTGASAPESHTQILQLKLQEDSPGSCRASLRWKGQTRTQQFQSPYRSALLKERELQYFAEMALLFWLKELRTEL